MDTILSSVEQEPSLPPPPAKRVTRQEGKRALAPSRKPKPFKWCRNLLLTCRNEEEEEEAEEAAFATRAGPSKSSIFSTTPLVASSSMMVTTNLARGEGALSSAVTPPARTAPSTETSGPRGSPADGFATASAREVVIGAPSPVTLAPVAALGEEKRSEATLTTPPTTFTITSTTAASPSTPVPDIPPKTTTGPVPGIFPLTEEQPMATEPPSKPVLVDLTSDNDKVTARGLEHRAIPYKLVSGTPGERRRLPLPDGIARALVVRPGAEGGDVGGAGEAGGRAGVCGHHSGRGGHCPGTGGFYLGRRDKGRSQADCGVRGRGSGRRTTPWGPWGPSDFLDTTTSSSAASVNDTPTTDPVQLQTRCNFHRNPIDQRHAVNKMLGDEFTASVARLRKVLECCHLPLLDTRNLSDELLNQSMGEVVRIANVLELLSWRAHE
uniref:Uncharacterized protein n=1 Tax=Oryza punctata TaxID=4537 RepID=A0A0E0JHJ0_ORYPU